MHKRYTVLFYVITFTILFLIHAATASAGSTTLSWYPPTANEDGTPLTDLAGYKIYYGTASRSYTQSIDVGNKTIQTVPNLSEGVTYYFAATAYNTSQKESTYSNEISRTMSMPTPLPTPTPNPTPTPQPTPSPLTHVLTVDMNGTGTGTVTSSPAGISCGSDCTETYNAGTAVTLSALPDENSVFSGWSGACTGTGACIVTMDAAKSVTATFTMKTYTITATAGTGGRISPSGSIVVNHGSNQIFSITADTDYEIAKVLVDGKSVGTAGAYTFTDVTASYTISAKFANLADGTIADSYFINLPMTGQTESYAFEDDGDIEAGIAWPEQRFLDNGDGTVTDTLTGLMWLKDGGCLNKKKWNDALITIVEMNANPGRYSCTGYSANYRDWRLPNVRELDSLINYGESDSYAWMNASGFSSMKGSYYWSSTTNTDKANKAYGVNMKKTRRIVIPKKNKNYMLPVRGGVLPETEEKKY